MRIHLAAGLAGLLLLSACTGDDDPVVDSTPTVTSPSPTETDTPTATPTDTGTATATDPEPRNDDLPGEGTPIRAELSGALVVPGPGDETGSGLFRGRLLEGEASVEVCYELVVENLGSGVTAAHIHEGSDGASGPPVVELLPPVDGTSEDCAVVDAGTAVDLLENPGGFYVQVHTEGHPDGAVRGQLQD